MMSPTCEATSRPTTSMSSMGPIGMPKLTAQRSMILGGEHGLVEIRSQHAVHHESRCAAARHGQLVEPARKTGRRLYRGRRGALGVHHLDERHLWHRVEEVQSYQSLGVCELCCQRFEHDARGVGGKQCAWLHARLEPCVQLL